MSQYTCPVSVYEKVTNSDETVNSAQFMGSGNALVLAF